MFSASRFIVAQKNKQRQIVIKSLKLQARFVEVHSNGDEAIFKSSGFVAASTTKVESIPKAKSYEFRYGAVVNGAPPTSWTSKVVSKVKPPVGFEGLTPGTVYAFQVRAFGVLGYTDWTDSQTCMCVARSTSLPGALAPGFF